MDPVTYFQAVLPPPDEISGRLDALCTPGSADLVLEYGRDGLLQRTLVPLSAALRNQIDLALATGDATGALQMAFGAACGVCDAFATESQPLTAEQGRIHALVLELEDIPWGSAADGTLIEGGTAVQISYRNWTVDGATAAEACAALAETDGAAPGMAGWPAAWVVS